MLSENPYQSPLVRNRSDAEGPQWRRPAWFAVACKGCFWLGVVAALIGLLRLAGAGYSVGWHLATAALLAAGAFTGQRTYCILGIAGCIALVIAALVDYQRGIELQQDLRDLRELQRGIHAPSGTEEEISLRREGAKKEESIDKRTIFLGALARGNDFRIPRRM